MARGKLNAITDVEGLLVGEAHDAKVRTGVSVLLPDEPLRAAVDVRGGGPGTRETDALALETLVDQIDALVLSGGSVYGLAAADAVCRRLGAEGRGFGLVDRPGVPKTPIVPAAIIYDLANGGQKDWGEEPPYAALAAKALRASKRQVDLGKVGAGAGAMAGAYPGGLGTASWVSEDGFTVGALVAVNSFGSPYLAGTNQFWAAPYEVDGEYGGRGMPPKPSAQGFPSDTKAAAPRENTTIAIIATDADLSCADLKRVAIMAQDGLARAIRPAHGPTDGDVIFAVSTSRRSVPMPSFMTVSHLGSIAGDVLARAIARSVYAAESQ
ncbi:MAG: P1 family peptidase [Pseudomonadota bacterium]